MCGVRQRAASRHATHHGPSAFTLTLTLPLTCTPTLTSTITAALRRATVKVKVCGARAANVRQGGLTERPVGRGHGRQVSLLNVLMELRKCCNHAYLFDSCQ